MSWYRQRKAQQVTSWEQLVRGAEELQELHPVPCCALILEILTEA